MINNKFRCIIHGSFRKHLDQIINAISIFEKAGIEVVAPKISAINRIENGFSFFDTDIESDPRMVELLYLQNLKHLGKNGFSYFVNPNGYIGSSSSYELGIAQVTNVPCIFMNKPNDHPVFAHSNSIWNPTHLADFICENNRLPEVQIAKDEHKLYNLWTGLMVPGSIVAVGAIIEFVNNKNYKEVLFVKTHQWGNRYSIIGGRLRRNESLRNGLIRQIREESNLNAQIGDNICTFDQIESSGYYLPWRRYIFIDSVARVTSRNVRLNEEAQEYVWMQPHEALLHLHLEPNAKHTLERYIALQSAKQ